MSSLHHQPYDLPEQGYYQPNTQYMYYHPLPPRTDTPTGYAHMPNMVEQTYLHQTQSREPTAPLTVFQDDPHGRDHDHNPVEPTESDAEYTPRKARAASKKKATKGGKGGAAKSKAKPKSKGKSKPKSKSKATGKGAALASSQPASASASIYIHPLAPLPPNLHNALKNRPMPPSDPSIEPYLQHLDPNGLLPAPPGSRLDVNELLIVHPAVANPEQHQALPGGLLPSRFEQYTCRMCRKTYEGRNARSVARRHLQDKHDVPLASQPRRSRWDFNVDRPSGPEEARERSLKCKRDWALRHRKEQQKERERELAPATKGASAKKKTTSRRKHKQPHRDALSHERDNQSDEYDEHEDDPHEDEPMNEVSQQEQMALRGLLYMDQSALAAYQAMISAQHSAWYAYQHGRGSSATEGAYDTAYEIESSEVDPEHGQDQDAEGESEIDPYDYDAAANGVNQWAQPPLPGAGWTQHASPWANDAAWIEGTMRHGSAHSGVGNSQQDQSFAAMPQSQPTFHVWPGVGNFVYQPFDPHGAQNGQAVPHQFEYNVAHDPQSVQETHDSGSGSGADEFTETTEITAEGVDDPLELAAESLLDLHSTPLAPSPTKSSQSEVTPPAVPPSRTGLGARSLSFSGLDDPFAFPSVDPASNKGTLEKVTESHAAPSPSDKDVADSRTEMTATSSPVVEPQAHIRKPLIGLKPNLDFSVTPFKLGVFAMPGSVSQPTPFHSTITPAFSTGHLHSTPLHHDLPSSGILATPLTRRPFDQSTGAGTGTGTGTGAGTAGRGWLLSSPANAEAAAALGLQAHAWYPETPGFVDVVMAETPVRSLKRSKSKAVALVRDDGDE
ncbi:hypothetical protein EHS25_002327 [Saitozyma podzolica]|uniref:Uncharacterized protein n=1 Tax=Saitozyma podzolica TaxID=1890683 RepID=A0A427YDI1_9TREE|nr:hypothetical protein EHS25_002327 [Saitozyma podzolica]